LLAVWDIFQATTACVARLADLLAAVLTAWGNNLMDLSALNVDWLFFARALNIIFINLLLSGDNAVVIAMAVRSLPRRQRQWGIILGSLIAVVLLVTLTYFVAQILEVKFIRIIGGALIVWIAVRLFVEGAAEQKEHEAASLLQAIWLILLADITMSTDNVLAVAAISHGSLFLLILGLAFSVPFVILTSNLLSTLMDRYPIIIYVGAFFLGRVAGEMILSDPMVESWLKPSDWLAYSIQAVFAVGVIVVGKVWLWLAFRRAEQLESS